MKYELLTSLLSIIGTLLGSMFGVVTSAKLTNFRIESLEKKVDKHNNFAERIPKLEALEHSNEDAIKRLETFHME